MNRIHQIHATDNKTTSRQQIFLRRAFALLAAASFALTLLWAFGGLNRNAHWGLSLAAVYTLTVITGVLWVWDVRTSRARSDVQ